MKCANTACGNNSLITVFGASGLHTYCQKCGAVPAKPEPPAAPAAKPAVAPEPAALQVAMIAAKRGDRITGGSVLTLARAEARELKREIRVLEAKKRQLAALQRLISAAAKKPASEGASNVRQLRKQGS